MATKSLAFSLMQTASEKVEHGGLGIMETAKIRCFGDTPIYIDYHDNEWGRPVHEDRKLFEMCL